MNKVNKIEVGLGFLVTILLYFVICDHALFWDTVQFGGKHPAFFYENDFNAFLLPDEIDSGHVPLFGFYIALCWKLLGKNLAITHLAMMPFVFGVILQILIYCKRNFKNIGHVAIFLLLLDPTLNAQMILVSPDVILIFFFLFVLNNIQSKDHWRVLIGACGLTLISMRGVSVLAALYCYDLFYNRSKLSLKYLVRTSLFYIPAMLLFSSYQHYHFYEKGWIFYHDASPWSPSFKQASPTVIVKNIGLLFWRLIDFGRIVVYAFLLWLILKFIRKDNFTKIKSIFEKENSLLNSMFLCFFLLIFLTPSFICYEGLNGHRYVLPLILSVTILFLDLIDKRFDNNKPMIYLSILALVFGNFLFYPKHISQSWDSSLAHIGYYKCIDKMIDFIDGSGIVPSQVVSTFPVLGQFGHLYNNNDFRKFSDLDTCPNCKYVLISNFNSKQFNNLRYSKVVFNVNHLGFYMKLVEI